MALIVSLNELSCASALSPTDVAARMDGLVTVLQAVRRRRPDAALLTAERLPDIVLAAGYPMNRWAADRRNVDQWRFLRRMQDKAPFRFADVGPNLDHDEQEYRFGAEIAQGLGLAHWSDGIAVSLAVDGRWDDHILELTLVSLDRADDVVTARHVSSPGHVEQHQEWLARRDVDDLATGAQLWAARADLFPDLTFLPRVEGDLGTLQPSFLPAVKTRLLELQEAVREWDPADGAGPLWRSHVTPEHEGRRALCWFNDLDGELRLFDLHARFTPGPMRLHLRLVPSERTACIAYIGRKLGI